ncbi:hypothetical protein C8J56DRAFT_1134422, partial [Mycena floridula]
LPPTIAQLLSRQADSSTVSVNGWVKSIRRQKRVAFAVIGDGTNASGIQAVFGDTALAKNLTNGASVRLTGRLTESIGPGQAKELQVVDAEVLGPCDPETYPIQKQSLSLEYLRENVHLRARTNAIATMLRLRCTLATNIHHYFEVRDDTQGFCYAHTPILTGADTEGAGEAFRLAQMDSTDAETNEFFAKPAHLTVSSQLHLEALTSSISRVYTLSPCFRAERSQTNRHLAEFWMLEAEWTDTGAAGRAPDGVQGICSFVEDHLREIVSPLLGSSDLDALWTEGDQQKREALDKCMSSAQPWVRMSYSEAVKELEVSNQTFQFPPKWGRNLQSEHERWLSEQLVRGPIFITDYPKALKPFYMRSNDDSATVACFDLIVPHVGELVGGSVREERLPILEETIRKLGMPTDEYQWYLDLRRFGGAPHVGFGMGFERLVGWIGGIENIRECLPMPRWAGKMLL